MAPEMGWVHAPFLTCVELHASCFSSAACKKTGSAEDSHGKPFPAESRTVSHTTHVTFRAKECSSGGCKISEKTFT